MGPTENMACPTDKVVLLVERQALIEHRDRLAQALEWSTRCLLILDDGRYGEEPTKCREMAYALLEELGYLETKGGE